MANTKKTAEPNPVTDVVAEPVATMDTRTSGKKRPRVAGALKEPVYLIHHGKVELEIPPVTRELVVTDPDDEEFGNVVEEEVIEAYQVKAELPKDTRFGRHKIGVAHAITDAAEAEALKRRGFVAATKAEIEASTKQGSQSSSRVDAIAAEQRVLAQRNLRSMAGGVRRRDVEEE